MFDDILDICKDNDLKCVCINYYIFLSIINQNIKLKSMHKIIRDMNTELNDFLITFYE